MHAGRLAEHTPIKMTRLKRGPGISSALKRVLDGHPFFANSRVPGQVEMVERFRVKGKQRGRKTAPPRRSR